MGESSYIAAIEIGSSKISGAVGVETYDGIKIVAYASEPVSGFITKGVVRNVDETSNAINYIINTLESGGQYSLDKTWKQIRDAFSSGVPCIIVYDFEGVTNYNLVTEVVTNDSPEYFLIYLTETGAPVKYQATTANDYPVYTS